LVCGVVEQQSPVAVQAVEPLVADVAELLERTHRLGRTACSGDEVDVVVLAREQEGAVGGERDRNAAEHPQGNVSGGVQDATRLGEDVVERRDRHATASVLAANTSTASTIPSSTGTRGSSCSIAAVSTPRSARASRKPRHHVASRPRPTVAKRHGAARGSPGQRWSSKPFSARLRWSKTTS